MLREAAERAGVALGRGDADAILAMDDRGTRALDVAGGRALVEYGTVRFTRAQAGAARPTAGAAGRARARSRFGDWTRRRAARRLRRRRRSTPRRSATSVTVRGWRDGDRMRPLGLGGTKTLQDLFTDRKVPRELRRDAAGGRGGGRRDRLGRRASTWWARRFRARDGEPTVALSASA